MQFSFITGFKIVESKLCVCEQSTQTWLKYLCLVNRTCEETFSSITQILHRSVHHYVYGGHVHF